MGEKAPTKLDLKKQLKHLYQPSAREVVVVDVPEMKFIAADGQIEPHETPASSPAFAEAIGALYGFAYTLKFMSKLRPVDPIDYPVMALEGLWTFGPAGGEFSNTGEWPWTLMIMQPDHVTAEMFAEALERLKEKHDRPKRRSARPRGGEGALSTDGDQDGPAAPDRVRLESFREGLCVQTMHIGPYSEEPRTIEKMSAFAEAHRYVFHGRHHEIYLGDPRRAHPDKLKTVLRLPVRPAV